jgi:O-antigen ligase/tetratricopeptide (TPR) repeat protein
VTPSGLKRMKKIIYGLFIFALMFSPLAFGTVEPWSLAVMETVSLTALSAYFFRADKRGSPLYEIPGIIPLLLLLSYMCLQLVPLPVDLIRLISPRTFSLYAQGALAGEAVRWRPLSIDTKATAMEFFRLCSCAAFYILTVQLLTRRDLLRRTVAVIAVFGSSLALFGILQRVLFNGRIYWIRALTHGGTPFGPYVNRNHYAGLMEMIFPVVLCLFLFYKPGAVYGSLRERISGVFDREMTNVHILLGLSSVLIATSIFLSLSRGGIVSLSLSVIVLIVLLMKRERRSSRVRLFVLVLAVIVLSVGWFGWKPLFERFETVGHAGIQDLRFGIWKDSLEIIRDFPVAGTGFGSFASIYPKYRSISVEGLLEHAHNDYIELLAGGGIVGFVLFAWFISAVLFKSYKAFSGRRERYSIYVFIGAAAGLVSILLHSVVDFNLQIGANGLYFFFLAGLAVSAAHTRMREGLGQTTLRRTEGPSFRMLRIASACLLALSLLFNTGVLLGQVSFSFVRELSFLPQPTKKQLLQIRDLSHRASLFDPLDAKYPYAAANAEWRLGDRETALADYRKAMLLNSANGEYTQMAGLLIGEDDTKSVAADALLRAGIDRDPSNPEEYKRYASWLFARGNGDEGMAMVTKAISLEPHKTRDYITLMVLYGLKDAEIRDAMPDLAEPHLLLAEYLAGTGNDAMADKEYKDALDRAVQGKNVPPSFFFRIYHYYDKKGMSDDALMVMNRAEEVLPENAGIHLAAGDAYKKAGITYRAAEEYRKVLIIDPGNDAAEKRLDDLRQ